MEYYNNDASKIDLMQLMCYILKYWRKIIVFSLIISILLGGYKYISNERLINNADAIANQETAYQTALMTYEESKELIENEVDNLAINLEKQNEYNKNSILMQINPFDEKVATTFLYIDTNYQINPNLTYQNVDVSKMAMQAYLNMFNYGNVYNYIVDNLSQNIELRYLKEILTITADYNTNMFTIQVIHFDSALCEEILDLALKYLENEKENIIKSVGEHTLTPMDRSAKTVIDFSLDATQKNYILLVSTYESSMKEKQNAIEALVAPTRVNVSEASILKSTVKYSVLGLALGLFLSVIIIAVIFLFSDKVFDTEGIYTSLKIHILGIYETIPQKRILDFIDRWLKQIKRKSFKIIEKSEQMDRISANIEAVLKVQNIVSGSIAITGTIDVNDIEDICLCIGERLKYMPCKFISTPNISYFASAIEQIQKCSAVVIIEKIEYSTYKEITKQLRYISNLDKKVIGAVIMK